MWIDSHCHLNHPRISSKGAIDQLVLAAGEEGVDGILTVCCRISEECDALAAIAAEHERVWFSIGTHPHDAGLSSEQAYSAEDIASLALANPKIVGIGESGLDYYYDNSPRKDQRDSFAKHVQASIAADLPIIIHTRDAENDTLSIMKSEGGGKLTGVMHCFSSKQALAEAALEMGFYISFSGMITFKKAKELRDIARIVPLDRVLIETDAPYLAPEPFRGKVNEPAYVAHTGAFLAGLYALEKEDFARITRENFYTLFKRAKPTQAKTGSA
ncbi:MAG: TatD family hydrolase [Alphaproteobacteria bacterium]